MAKRSAARLLLITLAMVGCAFAAKPQDDSVSSRQVLSGQSATLLPNGRILLLGGVAADGQPTRAAAFCDAESGAETPLASSLLFARQGHTATVLPDGSVLILGGVNASGALVTQAEIFRPETLSFTNAQSQPA